MPFNVLLLPLLGGYIFISNWNYTKFTARRYSGQRLVFHAAIAGVVFLGASFLLTLVWPQPFELWRRYVPYEGSGIGVLSFLLGAATWAPLNWTIHKKDVQAKRVVKEWNDFLEQLLHHSMDERLQVAVTLASGKYYAGYVTAPLDPSPDRKYMRLLPTVSGYRKADTQRVVLTTLYTDVYDSMKHKERAEKFQLIIPIASIMSANLFDPDLFDEFSQTREDAPQEEQPVSTPSAPSRDSN